MNVKEKVQELLKYCSSYQGHSYMVDERRIDETFRVVLSEETEIIENLEHLHFILLTGEAGDGKSHLLRSLGQRLSDYRFQIYQDFSALPEEKRAMPIDDRQEPGKKELIKLIADIIEGKSEQRIIIAANVGIFTKSVLMYHEQLLDMLNKKNDRVKIINFEKRNLADDRDAFQQIVESFYAYDGKECQDNECKQCRHCAYEKNIDFLKSTSGIESIRVLCNTIFLMGSHITFRELLSLLAHLVTLGEGCSARREWEYSEKDGFENIFTLTEDKILHKISGMDPAFKRDSFTGDGAQREIIYKDIESCCQEKRLRFFNAENDKYRFLSVDYLSEFRENTV